MRKRRWRTRIRGTKKQIGKKFPLSKSIDKTKLPKSLRQVSVRKKFPKGRYKINGYNVTLDTTVKPAQVVLEIIKNDLPDGKGTAVKISYGEPSFAYHEDVDTIFVSVPREMPKRGKNLIRELLLHEIGHKLYRGDEIKAQEYAIRMLKRIAPSYTPRSLLKTKEIEEKPFAETLRDIRRIKETFRRKRTKKTKLEFLERTKKDYVYGQLVKDKIISEEEKKMYLRALRELKKELK